ncbi:MAG: SBBP repeat-containing protein, partial [Candidatus Kapaibacterium sp.]
TAMESLNNRTYTMSKADSKPFFPADSVVAGKRILHTLTGLGNNKAVTAFIAVICFLMTANLNAQTLDWVKTFGGIGYDIGNSVTVDDEGNVYTTGTFYGTVDFDPGPDVMKLNPSGIFIQKLDANGNFIWTKSFGGKGDDRTDCIKIDAQGNIYTIGFFQDTIDFDPGIESIKLSAKREYDVFIQKLDANGNFLWAKSFGGNNYDFGTSIALDAQGNVYSTGCFLESADFNPGKDSMMLSSVGAYDIFVQKLDAQGNLLWVKSFGGNDSDFGYSIALDAQGNVYTTGTFYETVDFDPGKDVKNLTAIGGSDIFIQKLDANGNFLWAKSFGGRTSVDMGESIAIDAANNIYTTGYFSDTVDFDPGKDSMKISAVGTRHSYIQKLDANGNFLWAKSCGRTERSQEFSTSAKGFSNSIDAVNNVYIIGYFIDTVDFDPGPGVANLSAIGESDIFIQKLDANGNFLWAKSFGGKSMDVGFSINVDAANNIYTTGYFSESVDFDPGEGVNNTNSKGGQDIFVHKMNQTATGVTDMGNGIDISLYPNPSNGFLHIALNEAVGEAAITVTDLQGKIIHSEHMSAATKSSIDIQAPNGVYFVHAKTAKGQSIMKFIIE